MWKSIPGVGNLLLAEFAMEQRKSASARLKKKRAEEMMLERLAHIASFLRNPLCFAKCAFRYGETCILKTCNVSFKIR